MQNWDDLKEGELIGLLGDLLSARTFGAVERASVATNVRWGDLMNVVLESTDWARVAAVMNAMEDNAALLEAEEILSRDDEELGE